MNTSNSLIKTLTIMILLNIAPGLLLIGENPAENNEFRTKTTIVNVVSSSPEDIGPVLNSFVDDNIPSRETVKETASRTALEAFGISSNDEVIVGKEGWLYLTDSVRWHTGEVTVSNSDLALITSKLTDLSNTLENRGASLVLFIAPDKETIYPEYLPDSVKTNNNNTDRLINALTSRGIRVLFYDGELTSCKNAYQLYAKRDTHWLSTGAYIASYHLVSSLGSENPPIETLSMYPKDCADEDLDRLLGIAGLNAVETDYDFSGYGLGRSMPSLYAWGDNGDGKSYHTDGATSKSVYILRDSFFNSMEPFITIAFEETFVRHFDNYVSGEIYDKSTDIVLIEVCERSLLRLKDIEY